jgi:uncharacterized protein YlxW (UPF0749 family)
MRRFGLRIARPGSWQVTLGAALFVLGFVIAAQLRSEVPRVRYTSQERSPLMETARELQGQQAALKQRILAVRAQIGDLERKGQGSASLVLALNDELERARIAAGLVPLHGPGLVLQLQDSLQPVADGENESDYLVTAADVRAVVQELWAAGAEAVAVNGERIAVSTAIIDIGGSVLVNSAYLAPPYQISAIGPANLYDVLEGSPTFRDFVRSRVEAFGIQASFAQPADVAVPAFAGIVNLRHALPPRSASPSPSGSPAGDASPIPSGNN